MIERKARRGRCREKEEEGKKGEIGGGERWEGSKEVSLRNTLCRLHYADIKFRLLQLEV